jgi:hypothetical protein
MPTFFRIKARANGKFVSTQNSGDAPLAAVRVDIWEGEEFLLIQNPEDGTSLRARANGKFVAADLNQTSRLVARSKMVQQWEKFKMEPKGAGRIIPKIKPAVDHFPMPFTTPNGIFRRTYPQILFLIFNY